MQPMAPVRFRDIRQPMRRLEAEGLRDLHATNFMGPSSWNADQLVGLQAEPPARMRKTIGDRRSRVRRDLGAIHRLQPEMREGEVATEFIRRQTLLRENQLQF